MPTRLLLEGPDIESLLAQIRTEHGSAARIVSADKVRSGGIGGFFARERFEIAVEIDDDAVPDHRDALDDWVDNELQDADSVAALLDLADRAEARANPVTVGASAVSGASSAAGAAGGADPAGAAPRARHRYAEAGAAVARAGSPGASAAFGRSEGAAARKGRSSSGNGVYTNGHAGGRSAESTGNVRTGASGAAARPTVRPPASAASFESALGASLGASLSARTETTAPPAESRPANGHHPVDPVDTALPSTESSAFSDLLANLRGRLAESAERDIHPYRPPVLASAQQTIPPVHVPVHEPSVAAELVRLGVPEHLARLATGGDRYEATQRAMSALPTAGELALAPGDVLALVGEVGPALALADKVCQAIQLDPARILLAAPTAAGTTVPKSRLIEPADADRRGRRLHVADFPHIVVVAAPLDGQSTDWAQSIIKQLRVSHVWALVDATRKTTDLARHVQGLGRVDAIAVHCTAGTLDPASVLGLDLPVAYLDDRPASPAGWASLLCERLSGESG